MILWEIDPHTLAKHEILRRYLNAWFPIMALRNKILLYIDGFAGPGKYSKGEDGSPLIAINSFTNRKTPLSANANFLFIDSKKAHVEHLQEILSGLKLPKNVEYEVRNATFENVLDKTLSYLEKKKALLIPTFAFIDPFGYSQVPFSIIERLMQNDKCEVLINFMYEEINRFVTHPNPKEELHRNNLFGTDEWQKAREIKVPEEREIFLHDLYLKQLKEKARIKYVRSFKMINESNRTDYFLFFGSNHIKGLQKMKEAMWAVDKEGRFTFSDNTNPNQLVLFEKQPNFKHLENLIKNRFKGQTVTISVIEEFVIADTPFRETHYKEVLRNLEKATPPQIEVINGTRKKKFTYPSSDIIIKFI